MLANDFKVFQLPNIVSIYWQNIIRHYKSASHPQQEYKELRGRHKALRDRYEALQSKARTQLSYSKVCTYSQHTSAVSIANSPDL